MPIKPPVLDDRRFADIVREARTLIPQYCPEWTNLGDSDPGMTLVQLFAWMTEMTLFRLNRVPDRTYVHFLNFIGEERRSARPAIVPITFSLKGNHRDSVEIPALTRVSTRQASGQEALHYLTTHPVTVHGCRVDRMVAVRAGPLPRVAELAFQAEADSPVLSFGAGLVPFDLDPVDDGPRSWTADQCLYLAHEEWRLMAREGTGRLHLRTAGEDGLPIAGLFRWEVGTADGWVPLALLQADTDILGIPDAALPAAFGDVADVDQLGSGEDKWPLPAGVNGERTWIRGVVDYERWLAERMESDLEVSWHDDRGGDERRVANWEVRAIDRTIELALLDLPPIAPGWTVRLSLVDRGLPAGHEGYLPAYRWSWRRGDRWEDVPLERVRVQGTTTVLTGPFTDLAMDGPNLRARRVETVNLARLVPGLDVAATWTRPVVLQLAAGPADDAAAAIGLHTLPATPFQPAATVAPLMGMKLFFGSDLFLNRAQRPVLVEIDVGFEVDGNPVAEPSDSYALQLTYRTKDAWRSVASPDDRYARFTFADLDTDQAHARGRRRIRLTLDPATQLQGLARAAVGRVETGWLRVELVRANLSVQEDKRAPAKAVALRLWGLRLGADGTFGRTAWDELIPGVRAVAVEHRPRTRRLTRVTTRVAGQLVERHPFDSFIELDDKSGHSALYLRLDRPLPAGRRLAFAVRCRGETWLPEGVDVRWEMLESVQGRTSWRRLHAPDAPVWRMDRSGVLELTLADAPTVGPDGSWLRAILRPPEGEDLPPLPPMLFLLPNTVDAGNLHEVRTEKFSGEGVPGQQITLRRAPLYQESSGAVSFAADAAFADLSVIVTEEDGRRQSWTVAPGNALLTATKDDSVFVVDAVEGTLTFGNGIRGRILPSGSYNVVVERYHVVPGEPGNVAAGSVANCEQWADLVHVSNRLPGTGGRNAESIDEILRRAPSVLTSRDRAVTRQDHEIIATEASAEVARASCAGVVSATGEVDIVLLPRRRPGERIPDPFLSRGLMEHVQRHVAKRCLVNIRPRIRLATFQEVDVAVRIRLRPLANFVAAREASERWVTAFLDPYTGGIDRDGWPFGGTLYAQDFGRLVSDVPEVRHVVDVRVWNVPSPTIGVGWEREEGATELTVSPADLFVLRAVRVVHEEGV